MEHAGSGVPFRIKIPKRSAAEAIRALCGASKMMRDLFWVRALADGTESLDASEIEAQFSRDTLNRLGLQRRESESRRFRSHALYTVPPDWERHAQGLAESLQAEIDRIVADLYE